MDRSARAQQPANELDGEEHGQREEEGPHQTDDALQGLRSEAPAACRSTTMKINFPSPLRAPLLALGIGVATLAGCSHVAPYQREYLACRCMDERRYDAMRSTFVGHVYDAREGAMSISQSAGGGCGCN